MTGTDAHVKLSSQANPPRKLLKPKLRRPIFPDQVQLPPISFSPIPGLSFVLPSPASTSASGTNTKPDDIDNSGTLSPRTQIAQQFYDLAITCGGGVDQTTAHASANTAADVNYTPTGASLNQDCGTTAGVNAMARLSYRGRDAPLSATVSESTSCATPSDAMDIDDDQPQRKRAQKHDVDADTHDASIMTADTSIDEGDAKPRHASRRSTRTAATKAPTFATPPSDQEKPQARGRMRTRDKQAESSPAPPPTDKPGAKKSSTIIKLSPPKKPEDMASQETNKELDLDPEQEPGEPPRAFEPIRAALTWKDEEITVYDPNDKDDDGVGMDGVAFEPTPELAKIRERKRQAQLAAYQKELANDARANRRNKRRHESPSRDREGVRRVRFTDVPASS